MNVDRWVERRLATLAAARDWRPDAASALARLRERDRAYRVRRRRWTWIAVAASLASLSILAIPGRCDVPGSTSCGQPLAGRLWRQVFPKPVEPAARPETAPVATSAAPPAPAPPVTVAEAPQTAAPARRPQHPAPAPAPAVANFKESGSPAAPITIEIYTDYECPACAALYRDFVPTLVAQYVQTGKLKLLHRDLPLPQHQYSRLAARYANAAGRMGQYDLAVKQIFQTQNLWMNDGSVDKQLAQVLAPGVMQKVRALVENDATLDDTVTADVAMATKDAIRQTPTLVVVAKGKRQAIAGIPDFNLLKTYLEQLSK